MKIRILCFTVLLVALLGAEKVDHPVTLGLIYPYTTNKTKLESTNLNLSLLQNSVGDVRGANISGFSAVSSGSVHGVQASLLYSQINKNLKGLSLSTINVVNHNIKGVQFGLAANLLGRSFSGYLLVGAMNFVGGSFKGMQ